MIYKGSIIENKIREEISILEIEKDVELSTIQKILLSIRGPITAVLDVLYGELGLFMLHQHFDEKADATFAEMFDIPEGDEIIYREVIVHKNGRPLVHVKSYIPKSRCTDEILDDLKQQKLTTGKIIDKNNLETIRKINKISINKSTPVLVELFKTSDDMLSREYTITHDGKNIIWTKESYPISYFRENDY